MGGEAASPTNPKNDRTDKRKINMQTARSARQPMIINAQVHGPG